MAPAVREAYLAPYDSPEHRLATLRFVQDIPLQPGDPGYEVMARTAKSLVHYEDLPALICWGMRDFVFDQPFLAEWRRRLPRAAVCELPDAGHYVLEDAHVRIVPLVRDFLDRNPLAADGTGPAPA